MIKGASNDDDVDVQHHQSEREQREEAEYLVDMEG